MDDGCGYSFEKLSNLLIPDFNENNHDMCIGFIDYKIENNFYGKCLDKEEKIYIISFYQVGEFLQNQNIDVFNFMISAIYRDLTRHIIGKRIVHDETRGCLFDMCGIKTDIIYSAQKLCLCDECENKIKKLTIPENYIKFLKNEIKNVRKQRYYRIIDFIKRHPLLSIFIGLGSSLLIGLISNLMFDLLKNLIGG